MGTEEVKKLGTLLNYWIEHSKEHGQEFKEWAEKMEGTDEAEIAAELLKAADEMDKATEYLQRAREKLTEKEN
jgi:DNA gyrase/topoisomerase IV subunit A